MILRKLKDLLSISDGKIQVEDLAAVRNLMDEVIYEAVFTGQEETKKDLLIVIKEIAKAAGA
ncbi:MAG: hypothetical protein ABR903_09935, partial [Thermodesulfovibrionales bacterium]